jgi:hypothetical protein
LQKGVEDFNHLWWLQLVAVKFDTIFYYFLFLDGFFLLNVPSLRPLSPEFWSQAVEKSGGCVAFISLVSSLPPISLTLNSFPSIKSQMMDGCTLGSASAGAIAAFNFTRKNE